MNLFLSRLGSPFLLTLLGGAVLLCSSCVKQSEYDLVVNEKDDLIARLSAATQELQKSNVQLQAQQARVYQLLNIQSTLQKRDQELQEARAELEALKAEFDKFRVERRNAMLGKKLPYLQLDNGKILKDVEVTSVGPLEVAIRHEGGLVKVAMADTNDDFRWQACYDASYAQRNEREQFLAEARRLDAELNEERMKPPAPWKAEPVVFKPNVTQQLKALIAAQRAELNREYQAIKARSPAAFKGADWNASQPEASGLINGFGGRRAVLGMSRLENIRDVINDNLARLRSHDSASR